MVRSTNTQSCLLSTSRSSWFSGHGQPANWIVADIVCIKDGLLVEHWDVIEDEASPESSKSGLPMFGDKFVDAEAHELSRTEEIE